MDSRLALISFCIGLSASHLSAAPDQARIVPVSAEVLPGYELADGTRMAALRLVLSPGWKTYWRAPGDAGIPPQFDWSGARNIEAVSVKWPTPDVFVEYGMRSIGYKRTVTLPLVITARDSSRPIRLRGTMELGVCADVCLPYSLEIDETLHDPDPKPTPEIVAALANMPYSEREADLRQATCHIVPLSDGMRVEARLELPHTGGEEAAVIEAGLPHVWVSEPSVTRDGGWMTVTSDMMHVDAKPFSVDRSRLRITVLGANYAVDIRGCSGG